VKIGRLLGADALVLLSIKKRGEKSYLDVILSDCRLGARLRNETLLLNHKKEEEIAEEVAKFVLDVKTKFHSGILSVIGLSHFISKNFTHKYDFLQTRYAWVLGNALAAIPGIAVIDTEEAHEIGKELTLSQQTPGTRIVPLFVEGEYKISRNGEKKDIVNFVIFLKNGVKKQRRIKKENVPLSEAGKFLSGELVKEIMKEANKDVSLPYSLNNQIKLLTERADRFALRGDWEHSTGLREAVLLLNPAMSAQRIKVIEEYHQLMLQDFTRIVGDDSGFKRMDGKTWEWIVSRRIYAYWITALQHIEYLIMNKQTTIPEITIQAGNILNSICSVRTVRTDTLLEAETVKKDFLRNVWPLVLKLDFGTVQPKRRQYYYEQWFKVFIDNIFRRCDGNYLLKEDLDLYYETMEKLTPESTIPSDRIVYFLSDGLSYYHRYYKKLKLDSDYKIFLRKLTESRRPMNVVYGRYGLLRYEWINKRQASKELLQEIRNIQKLFLSIKTQYKYDLLREKIQFTEGWISRELKKKEKLSQSGQDKRKTKPVLPNPKTANRRSTGRLKFEEIELKVLSADKKVSALRDKRWQVADGGWIGALKILKCGDSFDVFWNQGVVLFMKKAGLLEEIFVDKQPIFNDIVWDGELLWIATRRDGIWIVKPDGRIKRKVLPSDGLPPGSRDIMLYAEKPGQIIAVGAFGNHFRAWCARITVTKDDKEQCRVFHEASRVVQAGEDDRMLENDPGLCFRPHWLHRYNTGSGSSYLLVGRYAPSLAGRQHPLMLNLKTLEVSVFARDLFMADHRYSESYFSRNGMILEAGDHGITLFPAPGQKLDNGKERVNLSPDLHGKNATCQGFFAKRLFLYDGWIYAPGGTWWRFDAENFTAERLVPWRLPRKLEELRQFGLSAHYGLVAWGDRFYKVSMKK